MSNFSGHEIPLITNEQVKLKMDDGTELILILQNDGRVRIMSSYCRLGIIPVSAFINITRSWNIEKLNELRSINKDNMLVRGFHKIANIFHKIIFRP